MVHAIANYEAYVPKDQHLGITLIEPKCWRSPDSWNYESTYKLSGCVVRVRILRDGFDPQSFARVHIFSPEQNQWNLLVERPIGLCASRVVYYRQDEEPRTEFQVDEQSLLREALAILIGVPVFPQASDSPISTN